MIYSRSGLVVSGVGLEASYSNQVITVSVETEIKMKPLLISVYRSPNSSVKTNVKLNEFISSVASSSLTMGDMRYRAIDWSN